MEPQFATQVRYNNYSPKSKELLAQWEAEKGIKDDEKLIFEMIGDGSRELIAYKGTKDADSMMDATRAKAISPQGTVNGEDIVDPGTGETMHILYFKGIYSPNRPKEVIMFMPAAAAAGLDTLRVPPFTKKSNPDLYRYLVMSNFMEDNANPTQIAPSNGYLYRLIRPTEVVKAGWTERMERTRVMDSIDSASRSTLLLLAPKLPGVAHPEGISDDQLRENFANYAERGQNYKTLDNLFSADETKFNQQVEKAIDSGVVYADKEAAMWRFSASQEAICPASPTDSTTKQLVTFLQVQDGQISYKQILALLAKKK